MDTASRVDARDLLTLLLEALPAFSAVHSPESPAYLLLAAVAAQEAQRFGPEASQPVSFEPFGEILFPYTSMGAITSVHLFGLDELILFAFYRANRHRYHRVADIGANIGLHSIVLGRCGYEVHAYEPDPHHYSLLQQNLKANNCTTVSATCAAVSVEAGELEFVRVLGNTTGSHLVGAKANPYGALDRFPVSVEAAGPIFEWADLVKLDVEGHEGAILLATDASHWKNMDAIAEVGSADNARTIYDYLHGLGVRLFAQKHNWSEVQSSEEMPVSYHDGSLFITTKPSMPWS